MAFVFTLYSASPLVMANAVGKRQFATQTIVTKEGGMCELSTQTDRRSSATQWNGPVTMGYAHCERSFQLMEQFRRTCPKFRAKFPGMTAKDYFNKTVPQMEALFPGITKWAKKNGYFLGMKSFNKNSTGAIVLLNNCFTLSGGLKQPWESSQFVTDFARCRSLYEISCNRDANTDQSHMMVGGHCVDSISRYNSCAGQYLYDLHLERACHVIHENFADIKPSDIYNHYAGEIKKKFPGLEAAANSQGLGLFDVANCVNKVFAAGRRSPSKEFQACLRPITVECTHSEKLRRSEAISMKGRERQKPNWPTRTVNFGS